MQLRKGISTVLYVISVRPREKVPGACLPQQQTEIQQRNFRQL